MKKTLYTLCALAVISLSAVSCLNIHISAGGKNSIRCKGPVVEKELELSGFSHIAINGHSDLFLSQADTYSVRVKANEEVFDYLDFRVEDGVLLLQNKDKKNLRADTFDVFVTLPCMESLSINGAADVKLQTAYAAEKDLNVIVNGAGDILLKDVKLPNLNMVINGAGDIKVSDMDVMSLSLSISGAGDAVLSGKADSASFSVSGAGDIDARGLECENISKHKAGVASIRLRK